jgi:hypothetical protein
MNLWTHLCSLRANCIRRLTFILRILGWLMVWSILVANFELIFCSSEDSGPIQTFDTLL